MGGPTCALEARSPWHSALEASSPWHSAVLISFLSYTPNTKYSGQLDTVLHSKEINVTFRKALLGLEDGSLRPGHWGSLKPV